MILPIVAASVFAWFSRNRSWALIMWHWPLKNSPAWRTVWATFMVMFSAGLFGSALVGVLGQYLRAVEQLRNGRTKVVEGVVGDFSPASPIGGMERFCIDRVCFRYSDNVVIPGFHKTSSQGGPIHQGLRALIHYVGPDDSGEILRLEVAQ
jgi:hypothetical protein